MEESGGEKERVVIATNIDTKSFRLATLVPYATMPLQTFDCFSCMPPIHKKTRKVTITDLHYSLIAVPLAWFQQNLQIDWHRSGIHTMHIL